MVQNPMGAAMTTLTLDERTIRHLEPGLIQYARRRVGREDVAQDLVQETWLAAVNSFDGFEGRSSLRTWLISILRRKIVDLRRKQRPQVHFDEHHVAPVLPPRREHLDDQRGADAAREALTGLPPREQEAVRLCDVEGIGRDEAAERMGVSRGALRVLLHRGRLKLKTQLEQRGVAFE